MDGGQRATEGQSLRVIVLPPFYRTWGFIMLSAIGSNEWNHLVKSCGSLYMLANQGRLHCRL